MLQNIWSQLQQYKGCKNVKKYNSMYLKEREFPAAISTAISFHLRQNQTLPVLPLFLTNIAIPVQIHCFSGIKHLTIKMSDMN